MRLIHSKDAIKSLKKLPINKQKKIAMKLGLLMNNPLAGKALQGKFERLYSLRIWPYRVLYELSNKERLIMVHKIEHRQGVYK